jgi:hypothetical protein
MQPPIEIIKKELGIEFKTGAIGLYLAQILNKVDGRSLELEEVEKKWDVINSVLDFACSHYDTKPFNFLIFPEISVPYKYRDKLIKRIKKNDFPSNTITILGLEHISVKNCGKFINSIEESDERVKKSMEKLEVKEKKNKKVNLCLIALKSGKGSPRFFIQPKIMPSKYEGSENNIENLFQGNFIYYFISDEFNFIVLICSDFFKRAVGSLTKIIDVIDYEIIKQGNHLDFIINIQHNPYKSPPEDKYFFHSLNRLYDDGEKCHRHLCTIFLNSVISNSGKGDPSKVMFYKTKKINLQEREPLKQIDAPVVGYEFPKGERLIYLSFDRLPKYWGDCIDPPEKEDRYPIHFDLYKLVKNKWVYQDNGETHMPTSRHKGE